MLCVRAGGYVHVCDLVLLEGQLAGGQECLVALLDGEGEVPVEHLQVPLAGWQNQKVRRSDVT